MSGHTPTQASPQLSASTQVVSGRQMFRGVNIHTDGTNAGTVIIYDGIGATGKIVGTFSCVGTNLSKDVIFNEPVRVYTGIYADLSGTGATCNVYFSD